MRWRAARALGEIRDPRAIGPLITALQADDCFVRRDAAEALCKIGTAALDQLIAALACPLDDGRKEVAEVLGRLGHSRALRPLIESLRDPAPQVRCAAAWALGELGDQGAVEHLQFLLSDDDRYVAGEAKSALERIGKKSQNA